MKFIDYLKDKFIYIVVNIIVFIMISVLLIIFRVHPICVIYSLFIFACTIIFNIFYEYLRKRDFYNNLSKLMSTLDKEYLITELIHEPSFLEGKLLYEYLYETNKSMIEHINTYKKRNSEFKEYIELWCHEIKTPIATSKMIITNNKNEITKSINEEIDKIDNYIEQVLFYSRSNNVEKDYIIKSVNLNEVIDNVIKRNKKDLISRKIKVNISTLDNVYSDSKWLEFIINQIVVNSIKYDANMIDISTVKNKNNVILSIHDNGIGIDSAELGKVFDKGFTGTNGRKKYNSTGIGLYLCKKLCTKLGHNIAITSKIDKETTVSIVFPASSLVESITNK